MHLPTVARRSAVERPAGRLLLLATAIVLAVSSAALAVTAHPVAAGAAPTHPRTALPTVGNVAQFASPAATMGLHGRGNGHGHGMSQYGAQGAALAGLTGLQIVSFYFPGTTPTTLAPSTIRVSISGAGSWPTVGALTPGMQLTGYGALPTSGFLKYRLVPDGSGLALGGQHTSGAWDRLANDLPARADFSSSYGFVRLYFTDGTSTRYRGTVGAVRSGAGLLTINRVSLDGYTEGVVPREMPASWRASALAAQAIAARTYGRNAVESHAGSAYDICDTTWCQVYGGMTHYSSSGAVLWSDDPAAIVGNQNLVLRYQGHTIFAQFSASNGGAELSGGLPYLVDKYDPYDNSATGDPYLDWSDSVSAADIASYYGLQSVSSVVVTKRNGYGTWGGWVESATVNGTSWSGGSTHVTTTGSSLASAMGVLTSYFHFDDQPSTPSEPQSVHVVCGDAGANASWSAPADGAVTGYQLTWGRFVVRLPASARSYYVSPIYQRANETFTLQAFNAQGLSPPVTATMHGVANPTGIVPISPLRIVDTTGTTVDPTHPYSVNILGRGSLPLSGPTSVQLALTVRAETASGQLDVWVQGSSAAPVVSLPYHAGEQLTTTVWVPLHPTSTLVLRPSAGSLEVLADQEAYTGTNGRLAKPVAPTLLHTFTDVGTSGSSTVSLTGAPGVSVNTKAVLLSIQASSPTRTWLRAWPDDRREPAVVQLSAGPTGPNTNTVLVRLPASHLIHLAAGRTGVGAKVTLLGLVGNGGGRTETVPMNPIVDYSVPSRPPRWVGTTVQVQPILGVAQTPSSGATAVLVQFRVTATHLGGQLWAWPTGSARPTGSVISIAAGQTQTATALLRPGPDGRVDLQASTPGMHVSMFSMGYLASS